jgi:hypothetical protein
LNRYIIDDAITIRVSNALFGDPAPGFAKGLRCNYTINSDTLNKFITENDLLILP